MNTNLKSALRVLFSVEVDDSQIRYLKLAIERDKKDDDCMKLHDILTAVSEVTGVSPHSMKNGCRDRTISDARHIYCYVTNQRRIRDHLDFVYDVTLTDIGSVINKDHSSVIHGNRKIEGLLKYDKDIRDKVEQVENRLNQLP